VNIEVTIARAEARAARRAWKDHGKTCLCVFRHRACSDGERLRRWRSAAEAQLRAAETAAGQPIPGQGTLL